MSGFFVDFRFTAHASGISAKRLLRQFHRLKHEPAREKAKREKAVKIVFAGTPAGMGNRAKIGTGIAHRTVSVQYFPCARNTNNAPKICCAFSVLEIYFVLLLIFFYCWLLSVYLPSPDTTSCRESLPGAMTIVRN